MRKSNISHRYAKEKDFLIISLLFKHKTVTQNTKRFENEPAYEKFTRLKQENLTNSCSSLSVILLHMIMLLLFKQSPFVCITQSSNNTKFCTSESFEAFQQCLLDNQGINFNPIHRRNNAVTINDEVIFKKNQFSKQTGYTSNISISDDG